jgi:hypothetical protein
MNRVISWLQTVSLRQILSVFFVAITFLVIPAFSYSQSIQAQAGTQVVADNSYVVDPATIKRIQEKAEDLGDAPGRRIGDTGLENIKELGENIPETIDLRARQGFVSGDPDDLNKKNVLDEIKERVGGAIEDTKQAVQDAAP